MITNRDEKVIRTFGKNLRVARLARGLSMRKLALEAGLDHGTILAIEKGKSNPTLTTIVLLAEALGVDPGELLPK